MPFHYGIVREKEKLVNSFKIKSVCQTFRTKVRFYLIKIFYNEEFDPGSG